MVRRASATGTVICSVIEFLRECALTRTEGATGGSFAAAVPARRRWDRPAKTPAFHERGAGLWPAGHAAVSAASVILSVAKDLVDEARSSRPRSFAVGACPERRRAKRGGVERAARDDSACISAHRALS